MPRVFWEQKKKNMQSNVTVEPSLEEPFKVRRQGRVMMSKGKGRSKCREVEKPFHVLDRAWRAREGRALTLVEQSAGQMTKGILPLELEPEEYPSTHSSTRKLLVRGFSAWLRLGELGSRSFHQLLEGEGGWGEEGRTSQVRSSSGWTMKDWIYMTTLENNLYLLNISMFFFFS